MTVAAAAVVLVAATATGALAQGSAECAPVVVDGGEATQGEPQWERGGRATLLERFAACEGVRGVVEASDVSALAAAAALLAEARNAAAHLDEVRALAAVASAREGLRGLAPVPGAAAWLADAELLMGLVAAQSGLGKLAERSFERAVSLDPTRELQSGEAPPAVVGFARDIRVRARSKPTGEFVVEASVRGAAVFVDDRPVGEAPILVRVPVGTHLLRVEAPLHRAWGEVVDVLEGVRPNLAVALTPRGVEERVDALREAVGGGDFSAASRVLAELGAVSELPVRARWRHGGAPAPGSGEREVVQAICEDESCVVEAGVFPLRAPTRRALVLTPDAAAARYAEWSRDLDRRRDDTGALRRGPWYTRWDFWTATGVVLLVSAAAVILGVAPAPKAKRTIELEVPGADSTVGGASN